MQKNVTLLLLLAGSLLTAAPAVAQAPWADVLHTPIPGYGETPVLLAPCPNVFWQLYSSYYMHQAAEHRIIYSNDGGASTSQTVVASRSFSGGMVIVDLSALDGQLAWAIRAAVSSTGALGAATLLATTTGPAGFSSRTTPLPANAQQLHFFTATRGVLLARPTPGATTWAIYLTTDAGATWQAVATAPVLNGGTGTIIAKHGMGNSLWLTTDTRAVLRTSDQGATWSLTPAVGRVAFETEQQGLAYDSTATGQRLLRTSDGGQSWIAVPFSGAPIFTTTSMAAVPGVPGAYLSVGWRRLPPSCASCFPVYNGATAISRDQGLTWASLPTMNRQFKQVVATSSSQVWASVLDQSNTTGALRSVMRFTGTALAARQSANTELVAYPNPTTGLLRLADPLPAGLEMQVHTILGQLVQAGRLTGSDPVINLLGLPDGLYELTLRSADGQVYHQRICKTR